MHRFYFILIYIFCFYANKKPEFFIFNLFSNNIHIYTTVSSSILYHMIFLVLATDDTAVPQRRLVKMKHDHYCASVVCRRFVRRQCGPEIYWELMIVVETWQLDLITGVRIVEKGSAIIFLF